MYYRNISLNNELLSCILKTFCKWNHGIMRYSECFFNLPLVDQVAMIDLHCHMVFSFVTISCFTIHFTVEGALSYFWFFSPAKNSDVINIFIHIFWGLCGAASV